MRHAINHPDFLFMMLLCLLINGASLLTLKRGLLFNPLAYFIGVFTVQIVGTYPILNPNYDADQLHALLLIGVCFVIFLVSLIASSNATQKQKYQEWQATPLRAATQKEVGVILFLLVISFAASIFYYQVVGYNLFRLALAGGDNDFTTLRLQSYAGERYTGAGVFNQFKNTIMPISFLAAVMLFLRSKKHISFLLLIMIGGPIFLYCILGTGQRAFLFYSFVIFMIFILSQRGKNIGVAIAVSVGFLVLFNMYSLLLGRGGNENGGLFYQLYYRLFIAQQFGAVNGFRYVYGLDTVWGVEWFQSFRGLIPGLRGSTLSNEIHGYLYVSTRGTVPVSLWGSAYHNLGILGVFLVAAVWSWLLNQVGTLIFKFKKNILYMMTSAAIVLYSGLSVVSGPAQIFNNGVFGVIFILLVARVFLGPVFTQQTPARGSFSIA